MTGLLFLALGGAAFAAEEKALPPPISVEEMSDILDIGAPVKLPFDWTPYLWLLAGLLLLGAALWAWRVWRRRRARRDAVAAAPESSPFEDFERELDALSGMRPGQAREFYFRLSAALREYIERTASIRAMEMTTEELAPLLDGLPVDHHLRLSLKDCLFRADPVKFAGREIGADHMRGDLELARRFLAASRPPEPDAREPGAPEAAQTAGSTDG